MNTELKAAVGQNLDVYSVIKIPCRARIDRNRVPFPEIVAAYDVFVGETVRKRGYFCFNVRRKTRRQGELLDDHIRFDVGIVDESDDRHDFSDRPPSLRRKTGDV